MPALTEEQIKDKWCPLYPSGMCRGTICMMWRWEKSPKQVEFYAGDETVEQTAALGFCGLAGKP